MIEEGPGSQHGGQLGPASGGIGMVTKLQQDETSQRPQYSMPGILHFLQTEWARFEMERSQWEVERAELQVSYYHFLCAFRLDGVTVMMVHYFHASSTSHASFS